MVDTSCLILRYSVIATILYVSLHNPDVRGVSERYFLVPNQANVLQGLLTLLSDLHTIHIPWLWNDVDSCQIRVLSAKTNVLYKDFGCPELAANSQRTVPWLRYRASQPQKERSSLSRISPKRRFWFQHRSLLCLECPIVLLAGSVFVGQDESTVLTKNAQEASRPSKII
ncbi:hypothetical protein K504DRAFT_281930 [Pleomassaria siparia CBS 279.74]|uniref:Uncharacterized protein n=1 Tax=Pleomassaria siparia CBS 279.74 TaxID=1314801 RepID=A0A6G1KA34_9PLEO|nr:hypothetical protein K504DRAFT_281930 [Pleomassaria siparia CBS 279.74]